MLFAMVWRSRKKNLIRHLEMYFRNKQNAEVWGFSTWRWVRYLWFSEYVLLFANFVLFLVHQKIFYMSSTHALFLLWFYFIFLYNHTNKIHLFTSKYSNQIYSASCWLWTLVRPFILPIAPVRNYELWTRDLFRAFLAFPIIMCSWITSTLRQW